MAQSQHFPDCFYRVTAKGLLVRDGKLLLVEDILTGRPVWDLPGGGLDFGENFQNALRREVLEEMGLEVTTMAEKPTYIYTVRRSAPGHKLEWFYTLILAFPFDVKNLNFTKSDECQRLEFMSKEGMLANREKIADQLQPLVDLFNPDDFKK